ncbi:hypothetical protein GCM10010909_11100 [Acidocella aquatica]|uniref:Uncharacterized protein n=1 Tax=Acidocella aquatica TaxID=1922313 RepID=A0ABQ6A1V3_9PROT|nr:hypothetical protein [Acidocella aquatica]GLR66430.1 hypothetical protein GCM10010909_11100 [Acidocella aquatica]
MQLRAEIQIKTVIKALKDVIVPAIDPANKLAVEQAHLAMGLLNLLSTQMPVQFRFDHDELQRLVQACEKLERVCKQDPEASAELRRLKAARAEAQHVLEKSRIDPARILDSIRTLRADISALIVTVEREELGAGQFTEAEKVVLDLSREQLLRDRSLLISLGNEIDPAAVPAIGTLLPHLD